MGKRNLFYLLFGATTGGGAGGGGGTDTSDATATAADIRLGKTAYIASGKVTGTIPDYNGTVEPASGKSLFAQLVDRSVTNVTAADWEGIAKIGNRAFSACNNLVSVTIPNNVLTIESNAFRSCRKLKNVAMTDSVTLIDDYAFADCQSLESIKMSNNITSIAGATFYGCNSLTDIVIPAKVTRIEYMALGNCQKLSLIKMIPTTPPTLDSGAISGTASDLQIIVPKGTLATYKAATNWSAYADKMVEADT